jgi:hypothetical protein
MPEFRGLASRQNLSGSENCVSCAFTGHCNDNFVVAGIVRLSDNVCVLPKNNPAQVL